MENAKIKKLEPKEWLDRVVDNLDQLRILDKALRPEEIACTCLDVSGDPQDFPQVHLGSDNVRFFAKFLNLPLEQTVSNYIGNSCRVETFITYRGHYIFGLDIMSREEANRL